MNPKLPAGARWAAAWAAVTTIFMGTVMAQTVSQAERETHIDKYYPYIEQGAAPPGEWVVRADGSRRWVELPGFRTQHGQATIQWAARGSSPPQAIVVDFALFPDGSRGTASNTLDLQYRRRPPGTRRWIHGSIQITSNDVIFVDGEQPVYKPPQVNGLNLEVDLARDAQFLDAMQDDSFAQAVSWLLRNANFLTLTNETKWTATSSGHAAHIVAGLRGLNETYSDWKHSDALPGVYPDDRAELEAQIRKDIARLSQLSLPSLDELTTQLLSMWDRMASLNPGKPPLSEEQKQQRLESLHRQQEAMRPELERRRSELDASRNSTLALYHRRLAELDANAEVYRDIKLHLTRLGWRTENARDRHVHQRQALERALLVLQDVKVLEQRQESPFGSWVEQLGAQYEIGIIISVDEVDRMTPDEREVLTGSLRRRLLNLAFSGRITQQEFKALTAKIAGN
jgi:hypothetical protein